VVAFYFFALEPATSLVTAIIVLLVILTFVRWPWVHPLRVKALRPVTLMVAGVWCLTAIWIVWHGFPAGRLEQVILLAVVAYAVTLSLFWRRLPGH
nr:hypothetical protein [Alphaproteobacteria bacterium]